MEGDSKPHNLMHDRRVVRGNTYSTVVVTQVANSTQVSTTHLKFALTAFHIHVEILSLNFKTMLCCSRELQNRVLVLSSGEVKELWVEVRLGCKHTGDLSQGGEGGYQVRGLTKSRKLNWGIPNRE